MSAKVRFAFASECGRKMRFVSKSQAKAAARRSETVLGDGHLIAYLCSWSEPGERHFHVGHPAHPEAIKNAERRLKKSTTQALQGAST